MKKLLKILAGVFVALVVIGMLLPDPKKGTTTGAALAEPSTSTATSSEAAAPEAPAEESKADLEILKSSETANDMARTIHVKVRNNTNHLISYADLKGVYYDKKGNIVGTGLGNTANIAAGASKTIDIMSMGIENADRYEVEMGNVMAN